MSDPGYTRSPVAHELAGDPETSPSSSRKSKSFRKRVKSAVKKALHLPGKDASGQDTTSTGTPTSPWPETADVDHTTPTSKTPRTPQRTRRVAVDATQEREGEECSPETGGGAGTPSQHARRHKEHKGLGKMIQKCMRTDATGTDSGAANIANAPEPPAAATHGTVKDHAAAPAPAPQPTAPLYLTPTPETQELAAAAQGLTSAPPPQKPAEEHFTDAVDTLSLKEPDGAIDPTGPFASASSTTLPLSPVTAAELIELPASTGPLGLSPSPVCTRSFGLARLSSPTPRALVGSGSGKSDRPPSPPPPTESIIAEDAILSSAPRQGPPVPIGIAAFEGQLPSDLSAQEVAEPPPAPPPPAVTAMPEAARAAVSEPAIPWSDQQQDLLAPADALGIPMHAPEAPATTTPALTGVPHAAAVAVNLPLPESEHAPSPATYGATVPPPALEPGLLEHAERAPDMAKLSHGDALRQHSSTGSGAVSGAARELPPPSEFIPPASITPESPAKAAHGDALRTSRTSTTSSDISLSGALPQSTPAGEAGIAGEHVFPHSARAAVEVPPPSEVLAGIPAMEQAAAPSKAGHGDALTPRSALLAPSPAPLDVAGHAPHVVDTAKAAQGDALLSQAPMSASSFDAAPAGGDFEPYKLTLDGNELDFRKMAVLPVTPTPTPNLSVSESSLHYDPAYGSPPRPGMLGRVVDHEGEAYKNAALPPLPVPQYDTAPLYGAGAFGDMRSSSLGASAGLSKGLPSVPEQEPAAEEFAEKGEVPEALEAPYGAGPTQYVTKEGATGPVVDEPTAAALYEAGIVSPNTLDGAKAVTALHEAGAEYGAEGATRGAAVDEATIPELQPNLAPLDREGLEPSFENVFIPAGEEVPGPWEPYAVLARPLDSPLLQTSSSISSSCGYVALPPFAGLHAVKEGSAELEGEDAASKEMGPFMEGISTSPLDSATALHQTTADKITPDETRAVPKFESMESAPPMDSSAGKTRNAEIGSQSIPDVPKSFTATDTSVSSQSNATTPRHPESTPPTPPGTPSMFTSLPQVRVPDTKSVPVSQAAKDDLTTEYLKGQEDVSGAHLGGLTSFPAEDVSGEASAPQTPAKADERDVTAMYLQGQEDVDSAHLAGLTSFPTEQRKGAATESVRTEPTESPHSEVPEPSTERSAGSITVGGTGSVNEIGSATPSPEKRETETVPEQEIQPATEPPRTWASSLTIQAARTAGAATGTVIGVTKIFWAILTFVRSKAGLTLESTAQGIAGCTLSASDSVMAAAICVRENTVYATHRTLARIAPRRVAQDVAIGVRTAGGWLISLLSLLLALFFICAASTYALVQMASRLLYPERMESYGQAPHVEM